MDYTTLANVKAVLGASETSDDALLARLITEASRAIDRHCAGAVASDDYFKLESVIDEEGMGTIDRDGSILYFPKKPAVASVAAFAYQYHPANGWQSVSVNNISISYGIVAWAGLAARGKVQVKTSYTGGLASIPANLPADIVNVADVLAVRFYKEIKTGLGDTIGVADLGTLQYTKAIPVRVVEMLKPYKRVIQ